MSITFTFPTSAALAGARDLNRIHRIAGQEDLGFKIERVISSVSVLNSAIQALNSAVSNAVATSTVSGLSNALVSGLLGSSNFTA